MVENNLNANFAQLHRLMLSNQTGKTFNGKRDLYQILGYKQSPKLADFYEKYQRQDIAKRIISAYPEAVWNQPPEIVEKKEEDNEEKTSFETAVEELARIKKVFSYFARVNKLSNLGQYAILLIGLRDGGKLDMPAGVVSDGVDGLLYLMPFSQSNAVIEKYNEDMTSERYGLPEMYKITTGGYTGYAGSTAPVKNVFVHHSRVIHIAGDLLENDIFGAPLLESVHNRLDDLEKVVGGSAEIFWLNGRAGINLNADKDTRVNEPEKLQEHAEEYQHHLTRILRTQGMDVKTLQLEVASPKDHVEAILKLISGATGIPVRILVGSESGELASSQDEGNWNSRVKEYRTKFCEPIMLRPFIDRLMTFGVLESVEDYIVEWPDISSDSNNQKAEAMSRKSLAIASYANSPGASLIVPPKQFVEDILQIPYKEEEVKEAMATEIKQMQEDQDINEQETTNRKVRP